MGYRNFIQRIKYDVGLASIHSKKQDFICLQYVLAEYLKDIKILMLSGLHIEFLNKNSSYLHVVQMAYNFICFWYV